MDNKSVLTREVPGKSLEVITPSLIEIGVARDLKDEYQSESHPSEARWLH